MRTSSASGVRLAELIASLSLATDLGLGQPQEHVLRQTLIATRLAKAAGLAADEVAATYYVSLLAMVGCVADSHELAHWFGDDTLVRAKSYAVDRAGLPMLRFLLASVGAREPALSRLWLLGGFMTTGMREVAKSMSAHCETTGDIADRLGLDPGIRRALGQALERWDGKGGPNGLHGEQIEPSMRVVHIANEAEVYLRLSGGDGVDKVLRDRRETQFDPNLVDKALNSPQIFADIDSIDAWTMAIEGCAPLDREMSDAELQVALETLADYADLKSPWFLGHSRAVSTLAGEAARLLALSDSQVSLVERAALVCRLGGIGVSSAIWDKPGPLSNMEQERVRTVPYLTERLFIRQPRLADIGSVAASFHERMDGSGYPRGLNGSAIIPAARVLAAAEVYQALVEARPHRGALSATNARDILRAEVSAGRLDATATEAVLNGAGHQRVRRATNVAGLSGREVEVLSLLVRGRSNRQIAESLFLSPKTVGSHIEHIYAKIGVKSRGAAAMFAMHHGLIDGGMENAEIG